MDGGFTGFAYNARYRDRAAYLYAVEDAIYLDDRFRRRSIGASANAVSNTLHARHQCRRHHLMYAR